MAVIPNAQQIFKEQNQNYRQMYVPLENELIRGLDSTAVIDRARKDIRGGFQDQEERLLRDARRFGGGDFTALQKQEHSRNRGLRLAENRIDTMNNAYLNQYERNTGLRNQLINIGRGMEAQAGSSMASADSARTQRKNAGDQAKAQEKSQQIGMAASLGALAIAFF